MSAQSTDDHRSITELRDMDESVAKRELSMVEYQRWESLNDHLDEAKENRQMLDEADAAVHDLLVNNDARTLAVEVDLWGNDILAYYGAEDRAVRRAGERLADIFDVDPDDADVDNLEAADVDEEDIGDVKDALAELITAAIVEWNGTAWEDCSPADRESIRTRIVAPRDEGGWGIMGLMDAWGEIQVSVETARDDRLERVQKFRDPERRGIAELLDVTGFKTYREFAHETDIYEKHLIAHAIRERESKRQSAMERLR